MISKSRRFHGRRRINDVYRYGKQSRGELFGVRVLKNNETSFKVAVVVSKKVAKSAVARNRIRRKIYSCFNTDTLDGITGNDLIVNVFSGEVSKRPRHEIVDELKRQISRLT